MTDRDVVVLGAGITGLSAAWELRRQRPDLDVEVLEASDRIGGKLRTIPFAGTSVDVGADAFLARRPDGGRLASELGITEDLVDAQASQVWLQVRGRLRPLPAGTVMGVPGDPLTVARSGVLGPGALLRAAIEPLVPGPRPRPDESIGDWVSRRFGRAVADNLVEPLLGGVYAGRVDRLDLRAVAPMIDDALADGGLVLPSLAAVRRRGAATSGPVFQTVAGGMQRFADEIVSAGEVAVSTGLAVTGLAHDGDRWRIRTGDGTERRAAAVVVAVPTHVAATLLADVDEDLAAGLRGIRWASVGTVALAFDHADAAAAPEGSGLLVPRTEGLLLKAATFGWRKWPHLAAADDAVVRCSVGRIDDQRALAMDDDTVIDRVATELRRVTGITGAPKAATLTRWESALPQYEPGHGARVAAIHDHVARHPGLAVAGAGLDGVGVAPCIGQGRRAASRVLAAMAA